MDKKSFLKGLLAGIVSGVGIIILVIVIAMVTRKELGLIVKMNEIYFNLKLNFLYDYDIKETQKGMLNGLMVGTGDKYAGYIDKDDREAYLDGLNGINKGAVGILVYPSEEKSGAVVSDTIKGYSADQEGIIKGDLIFKVNETELYGLDMDSIIKLIKGDVGTKVKLTVYRESEDKNLEFELERQVVISESVTSEMLNDGIGYIRIYGFEENTSNKFKDAASDLQSKGMEKLIIDLRGNGGGLLDQTTAIADFLMPNGLIVSTKNKSGNVEEIFSDEASLGIPIAILVNGGSASASEVLSGALKDSKVAVLVGEKTFGKGIVQSHFTLSDGSLIKFTISEYFSPNGTRIHDIGITPDYEVALDVSAENIKDGELIIDNQKEKAIEVLKEK